jgi:hypothetical protein
MSLAPRPPIEAVYCIFTLRNRDGARSEQPEKRFVIKLRGGGDDDDDDDGFSKEFREDLLNRCMELGLL